MTNGHRHFHISYFPPNTVWSEGGYALYEISGEEIARCIGFDENGGINRRDSWPGYVANFATIGELSAFIEGRTK